MTDTGPWNPLGQPPDDLDPRCDATDRAIDAALRDTAPREIPEGLVDRVVAASLPELQSEGVVPNRLRFRPVARLALAACVMLAVVAVFWLVGQQPLPVDRSIATEAGPTDGWVEAASSSDAMARFRGLRRVSELNYVDAIGDLEEVVWAVQNGADSALVLSPGQTDMEAVENELDSVRVIARLDG